MTYTSPDRLKEDILRPVPPMLTSDGEQADQDAVEEVLDAAKDGDPDAQFMLYQWYYHGLGVPQSNRRALFWLRKAASAGHGDAMNDLGSLYWEGKDLPRDLDEAAALFRRATQEGSVPAHYNR